MLSRTSRLLAAAAVIATAPAAAMVSTPAQAASPQYVVTVFDASISASPSSPWTFVMLQAVGGAPQRVHNIRISFDDRGITDFATAFVPQAQSDGSIKPASSCHVSGTVTTCDPIREKFLGTGFPMQAVAFQTKPGAAIGRSGTLTVTVDGDEFDPVVGTATITVAPA